MIYPISHKPKLHQFLYLLSECDGSQQLDEHDSNVEVESRLEQLQTLLRLHPKSISDQQASTGRLPLHIAVLNPYMPIELMEYLIQVYPIAVAHQDSEGKLPFHLLCEVNFPVNFFEVQQPDNLQRVDVLIYKFNMLLKQYPESIRIIDQDGFLPLHLLVENVTLPCDVMMKLIEYFHSLHPHAISERTTLGSLPFHVASYFCPHVKVLDMLLTLYPNAISMIGKRAMLALHYAMCHNLLEVIQYLYNMNPSAWYQCDIYGRLPLHHIGKNEEALEILQYFYPKDVSKETLPLQALKQKDHFGLLPLHYAARVNTSLEVIEMLIALHPQACNSVDFNVEKGGLLPFHYALRFNPSLPILLYLIQQSPFVLFNETPEVMDMLEVLHRDESLTTADYELKKFFLGLCKELFEVSKRSSSSSLLFYFQDIQFHHIHVLSNATVIQPVQDLLHTLINSPSASPEYHSQFPITLSSTTPDSDDVSTFQCAYGSLQKEDKCHEVSLFIHEVKDQTMPLPDSQQTTRETTYSVTTGDEIEQEVCNPLHHKLLQDTDLMESTPSCNSLLKYLTTWQSKINCQFEVNQVFCLVIDSMESRFSENQFLASTGSGKQSSNGKLSNRKAYNLMYILDQCRFQLDAITEAITKCNFLLQEASKVMIWIQFPPSVFKAMSEKECNTLKQVIFKELSSNYNLSNDSMENLQADNGQVKFILVGDVQLMCCVPESAKNPEYVKLLHDCFDNGNKTYKKSTTSISDATQELIFHDILFQSKIVKQTLKEIEEYLLLHTAQEGNKVHPEEDFRHVLSTLIHGQLLLMVTEDAPLTWSSEMQNELEVLIYSVTMQYLQRTFRIVNVVEEGLHV